MAYTPDQKILKRYADVLVKFALGSGKGIKKGDVVLVNTSEAAKPLLFAVRQAVWERGGHVILQYHPADDERYKFSRDFFERAKAHQIDFFPEKYMRGLVDEMHHLLFIDAETDPHSLKGVDARKIMRRGMAMKPYQDWRREKEHRGEFHWTIALYGTPQMAKEAGLSEKAYWDQIIHACFLNENDPIKKWKSVYKEIEVYRKKLNALSPSIDRLHVEGKDADLWISIGKRRKWLAGSGHNIPSFEIFTSPDWRGTNGWIRFDQPLYRYGNRVEGIELFFKDGRVVEARARSNETLLRQMIQTPGADKLGEFSLTDSRHSRITKFMAETLYDENMGGRQGNTHIALGAAYPDTFDGDVARLTKSDREALGFNDSSVHTDIISTAKRRVTAHLNGGREKVIYDDGKFVL